jgi:hypothetical protein
MDVHINIEEDGPPGETIANASLMLSVAVGLCGLVTGDAINEQAAFYGAVRTCAHVASLAATCSRHEGR